MAWKLKYRCKQCGYEAEVYEGRGLFRQEITAVSCPDCKTIQNLVVGGIIADVVDVGIQLRIGGARNTARQSDGKLPLVADAIVQHQIGSHEIAVAGLV